MRTGWWFLAVLTAGCASGSGDGDGADGGGPAAVCETSAGCDDGDPCTTDVCSMGSCGVSAIDLCADLAPVVEDSFESGPGSLINSSNLGGWVAVESDDCPVGVEVLLDDHFDYGKPAAFESGAGGWDLHAVGGAAVTLVSTPGDESGYSMNVMGTTAEGSYGQAQHAVTPQTSGWVELRFRPPGNAKQKWITLDEGDRSRFYLYFEADGLVKTSNAGTKVTLQSYAEDTWYQVRMSWDTASARVAVDINDSHHADLRLHEPIERHIDRLRMRTAASSGLSFVVDDVKASAGDRVKDGLASLRVGTPEGTCERAAGASRSFEPVRAGRLALDLLAGDADGPYVVELTEGGTGGVRLELAPDGTIRWRAGDSVAALPGTWHPDEWLRVELRWDGTFDVWVGDDEAVSASGLQPAQAISAGLDEVHVSIPPAGALWVDEVRVEAAP